MEENKTEEIKEEGANGSDSTQEPEESKGADGNSVSKIGESKKRKKSRKGPKGFLSVETATFVALVAGFLYLSKGGYLQRESTILDTLSVSATITSISEPEDSEQRYLNLIYYINDEEFTVTVRTNNSKLKEGDKLNIDVDAVFPNEVIRVNDKNK